MIAGTLSNKPDERIAATTLSNTQLVTEQIELLEGSVISEPKML